MPVRKGETPLALSVGGPVAEIRAQRDDLVQLLRTAVEPLKVAVARLSPVVAG